MVSRLVRLIFVGYLLGFVWVRKVILVSLVFFNVGIVISKEFEWIFFMSEAFYRVYMFSVRH